MLVEMCGIPGSGKTTVSRAISRLDGDLCLHSGRWPRKRWQRFKWINRLSDLLSAPLLAIKGIVNVRSVEELKLVCRLCRYEFYKKSLHKRREICLLEESSYNALAVLVSIKNSYLNLVKSIVEPDVVIFVDCDESVALDRVLSRPQKIELNILGRSEALSKLSCRRQSLRSILSETGNVVSVNTELEISPIEILAETQLWHER